VENIVDIQELLKSRKWKEQVSEILSGCSMDDPLDILITLETYLEQEIA